jgi:predicted PurR-regulated permease PerM
MAGTIGLIISIPITAIVASLLAKADYKKMWKLLDTLGWMYYNIEMWVVI